MKPSARVRSIDLNLLPVLRELMRTRNLTRTAEVLYMSQSAVSEALKRMRHQFDDPVFVRVGRDMVPTPLMESLGPFVDQALSDLEALLSAKTFTARTLERQFIVAAPDSTILAIGPELLVRLEAEAPAVSIQFVDLKLAEPRALEAGQLDLAILPSGRLTETPNISGLRLYDEHWVYIARRGNPGVDASFRIDDARQRSTLAYRPDSHSDLFASPFRETKMDRLRVSQFTLLPFLVSQSDSFALIQRHVAERLRTQLDLEILSHGEDFSAVPMFAHWAQIHEKDPAHIWFRKLIQEVVAAAFPEEARTSDAGE